MLTDLQNHSSYPYKVRSANGDGDEVVSGIKWLNISVPPTRPVLIAEPDTSCPVSSCAVTLDWNEATNLGNGGATVSGSGE